MTIGDLRQPDVQSFVPLIAIPPPPASGAMMMNQPGDPGAEFAVDRKAEEGKVAHALFQF